MRGSAIGRAALLAALVGLGGGCGSQSACSGNTIYMAVDPPDFTVDTIVVAVYIDGVDHGSSTGYALSPVGETVTLDVGSNYVVGKTATFDVIALVGSTIVGNGSATATLAKGCTSTHVTLLSNGVESSGDGGDGDGG